MFEPDPELDNFVLTPVKSSLLSSLLLISCHQVTVHPRPETLPILIPVSISSPRDLANIERAAAADPGYLISVYTYRRSSTLNMCK